MCKLIETFSIIVIAFVLVHLDVTPKTWEFWVIMLPIPLIDVVSFIDGIKERNDNG